MRLSILGPNEDESRLKFKYVFLSRESPRCCRSCTNHAAEHTHTLYIYILWIMINILYTCTAGRYNNIVYKNINRRRCKDDRLFSSSRSSYFTAATSYTPRIRFLSLCFEYDIFLRYLCCTIRILYSFFRGFLNASTWLHRARNVTAARDRAWIRCNFIIIQTL